MARNQCKDFDKLVYETPLAKDFGLRNQMSDSSGSVMDCIAEGFERSGNNEFKNFLIIAKGSNGEYRSQLYRRLDRNHIDKSRFESLYANNITLGSKIMGFIKYLQKSPVKGLRYKSEEISPASNFKPQTSND
jgi:four helix bundle protein